MHKNKWRFKDFSRCHAHVAMALRMLCRLTSGRHAPYAFLRHAGALPLGCRAEDWHSLHSTGSSWLWVHGTLAFIVQDEILCIDM